jgi:type I restriction enzyme S subunit
MNRLSDDVNGWRSRRLRECLISLDSGSRPSGGAESGQGEVFSLGGEHIDDEGCFDFSNAQFVPLSHYQAIKVEADVAVGDILINKDGAKTGKLALVRPGFPFSPCCINEHVFRLRARSEVIEADYLFYSLVGHEGQRQIARNIQGSAQGGINRTFAKHVSIPHPESRAERGEMVKLLDQVEDAITFERSELIKARRLKTALMQQLFTRGIPGRHTRLKQTKIGMIPEEWDVITLGSIADVDAGVALNPDREPRRNGYRYLTVVNVQRERIDLTEIRHLELWDSEIPGKLLREGDIVAVEGHANSSEIGRAAMVTAEADGMAYQNHLFRIRLRPDVDFNSNFLLGCLNSERVRRHWNATANTSSGLNTINRRGLRKLGIPQPQRGEQDDIVALIAATNSGIRAVEDELLAVRRLKTSLLQNLLTGKVRIKMES